jgi:NaMN:DMB phosphoribosyltransferase
MAVPELVGAAAGAAAGAATGPVVVGVAAGAAAVAGCAGVSCFEQATVAATRQREEKRRNPVTQSRDFMLPSA